MPDRRQVVSKHGERMAKALVVNCSQGYNLGANKLKNYLASAGYEVDFQTGDPGPMFTIGYDLVALSVIFSYHAKTARDIAVRVRDTSEVWAGGPGLFALQKWWETETGCQMTKGLDYRFEKQPGEYKMTFASRGCPVDCYFCIVPRLEGVEFTLNWDFLPAPFLCDNNLSALPIDFQEHVIRRFVETNTKLLDANSGFEPITFDDGTYRRWKPIMRGPWRFALDTTSEMPQVKRMMEILKDEPAGKKRVYVLIGNEPIKECYERAMKVVEWGGEPYCQPIMALNTLERRPQVRHDWTEQKLQDMARWANRWIYRNVPLGEYAPRADGIKPFEDLL